MILVLIDTNIVLDIALKRAAYFPDALKLFALIDKGKSRGMLQHLQLLIYTILLKSRKDIKRLYSLLPVYCK